MAVWNKDITGVDAKKQGTFRSLNGAADENIFIGRASKAGFYCFFKVWRDMPYDAVLDYEGVLYRVEVKGSSGESFDVTRGSRSGAQIRRGKSRKRTLSREDCDFVVGVDSNDGSCYIIPEDVIEIIGNNTLKHNTLNSYYEKWELLMYGKNKLSKEDTRDGLRKKTRKELTTLAKDLGITIPPAPISVPGTRVSIKKPVDVAVFTIWEEISKMI